MVRMSLFGRLQQMTRVKAIKFITGRVNTIRVKARVTVRARFRLGLGCWFDKRQAKDSLARDLFGRLQQMAGGSAAGLLGAGQGQG